MKIAIFGGSGFVGRHLIAYCQGHGDEITLVSREYRSTVGVNCITWSELNSNPHLLDGFDAIVNLAGETINQRWTAEAKNRILQSRLSTVGQMIKIINSLENKPTAVISASGISIYGISEDASFDEESNPHITDFLAGVVEKWEKSMDQLQGVRQVRLRVGIVLGANGGALPKMAMPYKLFVGGRVGSGKQWLSWIHIHDMVRAIRYCIENEAISGPVNATAPNPVTNDQFGRTVAKVLHRPHLFPVPSVVMKLLFGELSILLLEGQRVLPKKLLDSGFTFEYAGLEEALRDILQHRKKKTV